MKKIILVAVAALVSLSAFAQQGKLGAGVHATYITADPGLFGVTAKVQYNVLDQIRPEASFTYCFKKDNIKFWTADVNVHYLFDLGAVTVYPLAGVEYAHSKVDIQVPEGYEDLVPSGSVKKWGVNLGCGVEYPLSESLALSAEAKYTLNKIYNDGSLILGAGVIFKF